MYFLTLFVVCASAFGVCAGGPAARLVGGEELESLNLFPHHVVISSLRAGHKCGGSILNAHWVLTSAACVKDRGLLNLYFGRADLKSHASNFIAVTEKHEQVHAFDSLALIRIHKSIKFSDAVGPVALSQATTESLGNRFAVMPGFNEDKSSTFSKGNLRYGMFMIEEVTECRRSIGGSEFRDDSRLCTRGWGGNPNTPCDSDAGSGLIVGWPSRSEIVGVFSESKCDASSPGVYIHLGKYLSWIENTIKE